MGANVFNSQMYFNVTCNKPTIEAQVPRVKIFTLREDDVGMCGERVAEESGGGGWLLLLDRQTEG